MTHTERALALRRIHCLLQLLNDDIAFMRADGSIGQKYKDKIKLVGERLKLFFAYSKGVSKAHNWTPIEQDMTSEKIKDYHILFDLLIQLNDINDITPALQELIKKQQSNDTIH